jgi:hypothetical protein
VAIRTSACPEKSCRCSSRQFVNRNKDVSPQVNPICIGKTESPRRRYLNSPARKCWESVSWKTSPFGTVQSGASAACTVECVDRECHPLRDSAQRDARQPSTYVLGYLDSVALRLVAGQECHRSAKLDGALYEIRLLLQPPPSLSARHTAGMRPPVLARRDESGQASAHRCDC